MRTARRAIRGIAGAILVLGLLSHRPSPVTAEGSPDVDEVLKKVDAAVFFHDAQEGLKGYSAELETAKTMAPSSAAPAPATEGEPAGKLTFDAAKGRKTQRDKDGQDEEPGSFTPSCGPWTLTTLMAFEIELFAMPFSKRFTKDAWVRECRETGSSYRLTLTPKEPIGDAFMLRPAITGIDLDLDKSGVPTVATLHLDQKMMHDDGSASFVFTEDKGKKRIQRIENELKSANLRITTALTFFYAKVSNWVLPEAVLFQAPGVNLSGTLAGMDMISTLRYVKYVPAK